MSKRDNLNKATAFNLKRDASDDARQIFKQDAPASQNANLADVFASIQAAKSQSIDGATLIPIDKIAPSATQPRRAIPSEVRSQVYATGKPNLSVWFGAAKNKIDWSAILDGTFTSGDQDKDEGIIDKLSPVENSLINMVQLAVSIRRDGLTNAITVAKVEGGYVIETGERRWLAFHLLRTFYGDDYSNIPCKVVDTVSIWRQATENTIRQDLTAIGQARQFALLLMDKLEGEQFKPLDSFEHEREFYAQVADGNTHRIPRGAGGDILNAMGLKNTSQLRYLRQLLGLSNDDWQTFDDQNTPLFSIRSHIAKKQDTEDSVSVDTVSTGAPAISDRAKKSVKRFYQAVANGEIPDEKDLKAAKRVIEAMEKKE